MSLHQILQNHSQRHWTENKTDTEGLISIQSCTLHSLKYWIVVYSTLLGIHEKSIYGAKINLFYRKFVLSADVLVWSATFPDFLNLSYLATVSCVMCLPCFLLKSFETLKQPPDLAMRMISIHTCKAVKYNKFWKMFCKRDNLYWYKLFIWTLP